MTVEISMQIDRINLLMEMLEEELIEYETKKENNTLCYNTKDYSNWEGVASAAKLKRLMLVLRQETIKLDKML